MIHDSPRNLGDPTIVSKHLIHSIATPLNESRFLIFDRRGIQTDLFAIERYVEEVLAEVLSKKQMCDLSI